jgi:epoxyqueuosine reductase
MVYGCDVCQEVCPWNRGVERRRRGASLRDGQEALVSLRDWLEGDQDDLAAEFDRLYIPKNDGRWLRRNALIAAGNIGTMALRPSVAAHVDSPDPMLADAASWALDRLDERDG